MSLTYIDVNEAAKRIRKAVKAGCKTLHVRHGQGTAYGWIEISGSADVSGTFTDTERAYLERLGFNTGGNFALISPDNRRYWLQRLGA